jgi:hypothetical protein
MTTGFASNTNAGPWNAQNTMNQSFTNQGFANETGSFMSMHPNSSSQSLNNNTHNSNSNINN